MGFWASGMISATFQRLDTWTAWWASGRDAAERISGACKEELIWGRAGRGLQHGKAGAGRVRF